MLLFRWTKLIVNQIFLCHIQFNHACFQQCACHYVTIQNKAYLNKQRVLQRTLEKNIETNRKGRTT